jgi:superkiller protein 8
LLSVSGASGLRVYSTTTTSPDDENPYPETQIIDGAHRIGAHHVCVSGDGRTAASAGFDGEVKVWELNEEAQEWQKKGMIMDDVKAGEIWAIALSEDGKYLAGTTYDGRVNVWDTTTFTGDDQGGAVKIREYETKGSFGMSVALVRIADSIPTTRN